MNNLIGIDLGGTNLRIARFSNELELEKVLRIETEVEKGTQQIIDKIINSILELKTKETIGVGISVPGQVDLKTKEIYVCVNIAFKNVPLGQIIKEKTGLNVEINNDANVAALAEAVMGAGKDVDMSYYITWSTGIGGGLVVNNQLISGKNVYSGEVGNIIIHSKDPYKHSIMCSGAVEGLTSGLSLKRYANEQGMAHAGELITAYKNGDQKAIETIEFVTDNFARLIATIVHVIEVDIFIIGGGVTAKSGDVLLPLVKAKVNNYVMPIMENKIKIVEAKLGEDSGIYGAALLLK